MRAEHHRRGLGTAAFAVVPVLFLGVFFAYPLVAIITTGLGDADLGRVAEVVTSPSVRGVIWFTVWQAVVSTLVTTVLALPAAYVLGRVPFRGKSLWSALVMVPFVLPTIVVGTAFLALLGPNGPASWIGLDLRRTTTAIVVAHVFFNYAVVARTVGAAWANLDPSTEEAASILGANPVQRLFRVSLPQLRGAIGGAVAIVFLFSFTSFGVVKVLGGARIATIEVEIHRLTTETLDLETAAILSIVQMTAVVAALLVHRRASAQRHHVASVTVQRRSTTTRFDRVVLAFTLLTSGVVLGLPIVTLIERSFATADGYGLTYYRTLDETRRGTTAFVPPLEAVWNSLLTATVAAAIALVVGTLAAIVVTRVGGRWQAGVDSGLMLPLGASAVTIGYGFLIALDEPPLDLRTSRLLVPAAQAVVAAPFVLRTIRPAIETIDTRLGEAARLLGASPRQVLRHIELPLLRAPATVAFGFAAAISLGEFGATVFIARASTPTVPVAIFRALGRPGALSIGQAMAMSTILMVLTASIMLCVDRIRTARVGTF